MPEPSPLLEHIGHRHPARPLAFTAIVAFNEDHAFVEGNWAEKLLSVFGADERVVAVAAERSALQRAAHVTGFPTALGLEGEGTLQARLRQALPGYRFVPTTRTTIQHVNVSRLASAIHHGVVGGRLYAPDRATANSLKWTRRWGSGGAAGRTFRGARSAVRRLRMPAGTIRSGR